MKSINHQSFIVLKLLAQGGEYGTKDIMNQTGALSPSKCISTLRRAGIAVADRWITDIHGARFKLYRLNPMEHESGE